MLLVVVLAAGVGWWLFALARRRRWDAAFARDLAEARWVSDSLVPSIVNRDLPVDQVNQQWADGKRRLDDLASDLYQLSTTIPNTDRAERLGAVTGTLAALHQALENDVALRTQSDGSDVALAGLAASAQAIEHRRASLVAAVDGAPAGGSHQSAPQA